MEAEEINYSATISKLRKVILTMNGELEALKKEVAELKNGKNKRKK